MTHAIARVAVVICFSATVAGAAEPAPWRVGLASARITPAESMWMAGYGSRTKPSEGTRHDLWVKAMAIESGAGGRAVVVAADLLGFSKTLSDDICQTLAKECGLARSQVMLTCSHTHCGPVLDGALTDIYPLDDAERVKIKRYTAWLKPVVIDTVERSLAHLEPGTLQVGQGLCGFAGNRRTNKEPVAVGLRATGHALAGPGDPAVPVLAARDAQGALRGVWFGYACHNTTLSDYLWCGDYAGYAQLSVEAARPGATALFSIGCGADQNPMPRRQVEYCQNHGARLGQAVQEVLEAPMRPLTGELKTAMTNIDLPLELPDRAALDAILAKKGHSAYEDRWAKRLLAEIEQGRRWPTSYHYPVQVWRLGDQCWIALGGEVVVDYALALKAKYGPNTWITGYSNDVMAYIPSHRVWEEGGYESGAFVVYGLPALRWGEAIESQIIAAVDRLVAETRANY